MTKRKTDNKRRSRGRRSGDLMKIEIPIYAAYLILLIRLVAVLTVQLHIDPTAASLPAPLSIEMAPNPISTVASPSE